MFLFGGLVGFAITISLPEFTATNGKQFGDIRDSIHVFTGQEIEKFKNDWTQALKAEFERSKIPLDSTLPEQTLQKIHSLLPMFQAGPFLFLSDRVNDNFSLYFENMTRSLYERTCKDGEMEICVHSKILEGELYPQSYCIFKYNKDGLPSGTSYSTSDSGASKFSGSFSSSRPIGRSREWRR
jgi:hypothetical protein